MMHLRTWSAFGSSRAAGALLALALGSAGCALNQDEMEGDELGSTGTSEQAIDVNALFTIEITPPTLNMDVDQTAFYDVFVEPLDGFSGAVFLDATSDLPFTGDIHTTTSVAFPPEFLELHAHGQCETQPGRYELTVTGTADDGSTASATATLTVNPTTFPPPNAFFFTDRDGFTVEFINSSFGSFCTDIVSSHWDFGDGTTSDEFSPTHTYARRGDYTVTLTVTDNQGLSDTASQVVQVLPPPPVLDLVGVTRIRDRFEFRVDLEWSGAEGDLVELHRNSQIVDLPDNDGVYRDRFRSLQNSFTWQVCELRITQCSNTVRLDVAPSLTGAEATVTTVIDGQTIVTHVPIRDE